MLFNQSITNYLSKSPEESWSWIEGISNPYWQDRAFGEYAFQSVSKRKDFEESRRALDRISDETYRKAQEERRPDWAKAMEE